MLVHLSGGDIDDPIEASTEEWPLETEKVVIDHIYRRISVDQAVFCGIVS